MIALVVLHHTAITYGAPGGAIHRLGNDRSMAARLPPVYEPAVRHLDVVESPILLGLYHPPGRAGGHQPTFERMGRACAGQIRRDWHPRVRNLLDASRSAGPGARPAADFLAKGCCEVGCPFVLVLAGVARFATVSTGAGRGSPQPSPRYIPAPSWPDKLAIFYRSALLVVPVKPALGFSAKPSGVDILSEERRRAIF